MRRPLFKQSYGKRSYQYLDFETVCEINQRLNIDHGLRLSLNENAYAPSPKTLKALQSIRLEELVSYPSSSNKALRKALAAHYNLGEDCFIITNGLEEMIVMLTEALIDEEDEVLIHSPTFPEYKVYAEQLGGVVRQVTHSPNQAVIDWQAMVDSINSQTKLIYLCNPNNPTGTLMTREEISNFLKNVPSHITVVVDEAYMEFVTNNQTVTAIPLMKEYPNLTVWRTFSKAYGLAFLRIGYGMYSKQYAEGLSRIRPAFSVNGVSEKLALAALKDQTHLQTICSKYAKERHRWMSLFDELGLNYYRSVTNFVMFEYDKAKELAQHLSNHGYQVNTHTYPTWIRLTLPKDEAGETVRQMVRDFVNYHKE